VQFCGDKVPVCWSGIDHNWQGKRREEKALNVSCPSL